VFPAWYKHVNNYAYNGIILIQFGCKICYSYVHGLNELETIRKKRKVPFDKKYSHKGERGRLQYA